MFEIKVGNIFDGKADACLIQCDGGSRKSVGKMGLQMEKRLGEDIWSDIMDQFSWPVALGDAQFQWVDDEVGCRAAPRPARRCRRATARVTSKPSPCIARFVITARPSRPPSHVEAR